MARIWIGDENPFGLSAPPRWWQDLVSDYDSQLRVIPSQKEIAYRLCRLVRREARLGLSSIVHEHPDTRLMIRLGLVPVATLSGAWRPGIVAELRGRDLWAAGGADAAVETMEAAEAQKSQQTERSASDEFDARAADAFRSMQYAKGERLSLRDINRGRRGRPLDPQRVQVAGGFSAEGRLPVYDAPASQKIDSHPLDTPLTKS